MEDKDKSLPSGGGVLPQMQSASTEATLTTERLREVFESLVMQTDYKNLGPREFYISASALLGSDDYQFSIFASMPGCVCLGGIDACKAVEERAKRLGIDIKSQEQPKF